MITYEQIKIICNPHGAPIYQNPWTTPDGKTAATDGKILIVVDAVFPEMPDPSALVKHPDISQYLGVLDKKTWRLDTAGIEIKKYKADCWECEGTGCFSVCPECDGDGECTCSCGDEHDCHKCGGHGNIVGDDGSGDAFACEDCGGTGEIVKAHPVEIQGLILNGILLEKIMALPGFRNLRADPCDTPTDMHSPLAFDFDGGWGVMMPMLKE